MPVTKDWSAGSSVVAAVAIHCSRWRPRRPVMITANARTTLNRLPAVI
jgi:hypothetical protein